MKSTTLIAVLTRLTTAMAVVAPIVVFGFLYVLKVQPARAAEAEARLELESVRAALNRQRPLVQPQSVVAEATALEEFDARTVEGEGAADVADALTALLNSPTVGGVSHLSIQTGATGDGARESLVRVLGRPVAHVPVTATFDARYEQIGRFFWSLRVLPTTYDLQSLELARAPGSQGELMRAKVSLLAFYRPVAPITAAAAKPQQAVDVMTTPEWPRDPFAGRPRRDTGTVRAVAPAPQPEPVVSSILVSSGRRVARVDGRIVGPGDRMTAGVIEEIEADAVVIEGPDGRMRRVEMVRPVIRPRP